MDLKRERDKNQKEVGILNKLLEEKEKLIDELTKDCTKYEQKALYWAKNAERLRRTNENSTTPQKNSINSYYPFPLSSSKKNFQSLKRSQSPLKAINNNASPSPAQQIDYSNMPNFYQKYHSTKN